MAKPSQVELVDAMIVDGASPEQRAAIHRVLDRIPSAAVRLCADAGVRIRPLPEGANFSDVSPVLRRLGAGVDHWPVPPAGLFVAEEKTLYLRSLSPMTIAHEYGHALDLAIGGGVYVSGVDPSLRRGFAEARRFVTPYAASGLDEWFAEGFRAYVGANDANSLWPMVSKERLASCSPELLRYFDEVCGRASDVERDVAIDGEQTNARAARGRVRSTGQERTEPQADRDVAGGTKPSGGEKSDERNPKRAEFHRQLTADVVALIERGGLPEWQRFWTESTVNGAPRNAITTAKYRGSNTLRLAVTALQRGYDDPRWMTVKQANSKGWHVRAGETGTPTEVWKWRERFTDRNGNEVPAAEAKPIVADPARKGEIRVSTYAIHRIFVVFNAAQVDVPLERDGAIEQVPLSKYLPIERKVEPWLAVPRAEQIIEAVGVKIIHADGMDAFYDSRNDYIRLPHPSQFATASDYYDVKLHENGHATGHESRLNRATLKAPNSDRVAYAREELRAELTSFFMSAEIGLPHNVERHAAYLDSWASSLRDNHMEIFEAARDAQAAVDFMLSKEAELLKSREAAIESGRGPAPESSTMNLALPESGVSPLQVADLGLADEAAPISIGVIRDAYLAQANLVATRLLSGTDIALQAASPEYPPYHARAMIAEMQDIDRMVSRLDHLSDRGVQFIDPAGLSIASAVDLAEASSHARSAISEPLPAPAREQIDEVGEIRLPDGWLVVEHDRAAYLLEALASDSPDPASDPVLRRLFADVNAIEAAGVQYIVLQPRESLDQAIRRTAAEAKPAFARPDASRQISAMRWQTPTVEIAHLIAQELTRYNHPSYAADRDGERFLLPAEQRDIVQRLGGNPARLTGRGDLLLEAPYAVVRSTAYGGEWSVSSDPARYTAIAQTLHRERTVAAAERIATELTRRTNGFTTQERDQILREAGALRARITVEDDIVLDEPYAVVWNGGTRWEVTDDPALYRKLEADVDRTSPRFSALLAPEASRDARIAAFVENLRHAGADKDLVWGRTMNEIRSLKTAYDVTTVRRLMTEYRKAVSAELGDQHPAIRHLRAYKADERAIDEATRARVADRLGERRAIDPEIVAERAEALMRSSAWHDRVAGVAIATGTRVPEIVAHGHFEPSASSGNEIVFSGAVRGSEQARTIPTLVDADLVLETVRGIVAEKNLSEKTAPQISGSHGKPVAAAATRALGDGRYSASDLRDLYAAVAYEWYAPPTKSLTAYTAEVLGYAASDPVTALGHVSFYPTGKEVETCERLERSRLELIAMTREKLGRGEWSTDARERILRELEMLQGLSFDLREAPAIEPPRDAWEHPNVAGPGATGENRTRDETSREDLGSPALQTNLSREEAPLDYRAPSTRAMIQDRKPLKIVAGEPQVEAMSWRNVDRNVEQGTYRLQPVVLRGEDALAAALDFAGDGPLTAEISPDGSVSLLRHEKPGAQLSLQAISEQYLQRIENPYSKSDAIAALRALEADGVQTVYFTGATRGSSLDSKRAIFELTRPVRDRDISIVRQELAKEMSEIKTALSNDDGTPGLYDYFATRYDNCATQIKRVDALIEAGATKLRASRVCLNDALTIAEHDARLSKGVSFLVEAPAHSLSATTSAAGEDRTRAETSRADLGSPALQAKPSRRDTLMPASAQRVTLYGAPALQSLHEGEKVTKIGLRQSTAKTVNGEKTFDNKFYDLASFGAAGKDLAEKAKAVGKDQLLRVEALVRKDSYESQKDNQQHRTTEFIVANASIVAKSALGKETSKNEWMVVGEVLEAPYVNDKKTFASVKVAVDREGKDGKVYKDHFTVKGFRGDVASLADLKPGDRHEFAGAVAVEPSRDGLHKDPVLLVSRHGPDIGVTKALGLSQDAPAPEIATPAAAVSPQANAPEIAAKVIDRATHDGRIIERSGLPYGMSGEIVGTSPDATKLYMDVGRGELLEFEKGAFGADVPEVGKRYTIAQENGLEVATELKPSRDLGREQERGHESEPALA